MFPWNCFPGLALATVPCSSEMSESSQSAFSHASIRSQTRSLCRLEGCLRRRPRWAHRMEWCCLLPLNVPACLRLGTRGARLYNNTITVPPEQLLGPFPCRKVKFRQVAVFQMFCKGFFGRPPCAGISQSEANEHGFSIGV